MVKIVNYVECDCEKGKLEQFASSSLKKDLHGQLKATRFFGCDNDQCDAIYRNFELGFIRAIDGTGIERVAHTHYLRLNATKEDVLKDIKNLEGIVTKYDRRK